MFLIFAIVADAFADVFNLATRSKFALGCAAGLTDVSYVTDDDERTSPRCLNVIDAIITNVHNMKQKSKCNLQCLLRFSYSCSKRSRITLYITVVLGFECLYMSVCVCVCVCLDPRTCVRVWFVSLQVDNYLRDSQIK